jgi:hypothetical protein
MYAPAQHVAVLVDVIFPGWAPFTELGVADFVPGLITAHDVLLTFDFDVLVAGHVAQLGTKHDVLQQKKCESSIPAMVHIFMSTAYRH